MNYVPLAEKLRPKNLDDIAGHDQLLAEDGWLKAVVTSKKPCSLLLWGPPGCGKTTLARAYGSSFKTTFLPFSGVSGKLADLKKSLEELLDKPLFHQQLILFIDEIHRLNKAQQEYFLPLLENGSLILVGATTENPSMALQSALLSRMRVLQLPHLEESTLNKILDRCEKEHGPLPITLEAKKSLLKLSGGDARHLLNLVEQLEHLPKHTLHSFEDISTFIQKRVPIYDDGEEWHYNLISVLHKAVRGSDPDAALYWLSRMFKAGEDPLFIGRRLIRMAVEDIGLADPQALSIATHACEAYERLGSPEGELALAQATIYLALAPKSNAIYLAFQKALEVTSDTSHLPPPKPFLNASTTLMKQQGYGQDYLYDHDFPHGCSGQSFFPYSLDRIEFYRPVERGFEREMLKRKYFFDSLRKSTPES
ncbi:MAG: replication-associated recombination protein A [Simkania sp.]|nr:replication-associated recombination protein A [Simkania sp.]